MKAEKRNLIDEVMSEYQRQTEKKADLFEGTSPGAWEVGTEVV